MRATPQLSGIAVHWHDPSGLARLDERWPDDARYELVVVDNSGNAPPMRDSIRILQPERNLGFAGGINLGVEKTNSPVVLLLNSDAAPLPGALAQLDEAFAQDSKTAGFAPRLVGPDGRSQHRWQLRPLPTLRTLTCHALLVPAGLGPRQEPPTGTAVEQPAGAALALRRSALEAVGGLDEGFHPAWYEDVDLCHRLRSAGQVLRYCREAEFHHELGSSVQALGPERFLDAYIGNLIRYTKSHHGPRAGERMARWARWGRAGWRVRRWGRPQATR